MNKLQAMGLYLILRMLRLILLSIVSTVEWHDLDAKDTFETMFTKNLTEYGEQEHAFFSEVLK